jgi:hypothetical protein
MFRVRILLQIRFQELLVVLEIGFGMCAPFSPSTISYNLRKRQP